MRSLHMPPDLVGARLARDDGGTFNLCVTDPPLSRAGSLPHWFFGDREIASPFCTMMNIETFVKRCILLIGLLAQVMQVQAASDGAFLSAGEGG